MKRLLYILAFLIVGIGVTFGQVRIMPSLSNIPSIIVSGTVQAEQLTSTDDADINDALTVGNIIIDEAAGTIDFTGGSSATITSSGSGAVGFGDDNVFTTGRMYADTYGSDGSITNAEFLYINTLGSNAQTQLDARCLESVLGTSIGTGLTLDVAVLKTHAALQSIAGLSETNGGVLYGTADNAYAWLAAGAQGTLLMGNGAGAPSFLGAGTAGYFLIANGANDPVWTTQPTLVSLEGLTLTNGDMIYATGADALAQLDHGTTGYFLRAAGAATPTWTNEISVALEVQDDIKFYWGNDANFSIEYDEDGNDIAIFSGADIDFSGQYAIDLQNVPDLVAKGPRLWLDGTDDDVTVTDDADLSFTSGGMSVVATVKMDDATYFAVANKGVYETTAEYNFLTGGTDKLHVHIFDESVATCYIGRIYDTAITSYEDSWITVAFTYDGTAGASSGINLYVNGKDVDDADSESSAASFEAMEDLGADFYIGKWDSQYGGGEYSKVYIFNLDLDDTDATDKAILNGGDVPFMYEGANQTELLSNLGFETAGAGDPDFWASWTEVAGSGALANEVVIIHGGADAAKFSYVTGQSYIVQNFVAIPGKRYRVSMWARGSGTYDGSYAIYDNDNAAFIISPTSTGITAATYTEVNAEFTIPAGCTSARVSLYSNSSNASDVYFDDISVTQIGCTWQGEPYGITPTTWYEPNDLDGTVTGAIVTNPLPSVYTDGIILAKPNALSNAGVSVADDGAITVTHQIVRVVGADADAVLDADPAINDGLNDGQTVILQGTADGNLVTIADNVNTQLNGGVSMSLGDGDILSLMWDSHYSMWLELYRSDN